MGTIFVDLRAVPVPPVSIYHPKVLKSGERIFQGNNFCSTFVIMAKEDQLRTKQAKGRMLTALEKSLGVVTPALKQAGVGRTTYYEWLSTDTEFAEAVAEIDQVVLDFAESKLHERINGVKVKARNGDPDSTYSLPPDTKAIQYLLSRKGKSRGYGDQIDITTGGEPIKQVYRIGGKEIEF